MDSITSNIVNDSEQETTTLNVAVSASEEGGVSDLAVCPTHNEGYIVSKGCKYCLRPHIYPTKAPKNPFEWSVYWEGRKCEWCGKNLKGRELILCKYHLSMLKSKQKVA